LPPTQLHHFRQPMDHYIEKAADHQAQHASHDSERKR